MNNEMNHCYLIDLSFCVECDDCMCGYDVDEGLYILEADCKIPREVFENRFCQTNLCLVNKNEAIKNNIKLSYEEDGLNINTLVKGFNQLTGFNMKPLIDGGTLKIKTDDEKGYKKVTFYKIDYYA